MTKPPDSLEDVILGSLSLAQRNISLMSGNALVTACPGAGKTRMVSARAAYLSEQNRKIALTSFTNVGAREMVDMITKMYGSALGQMHFAGTLHRLLSRYVLRPFGHLEMGCRAVPQVHTGGPETEFIFEGVKYASNDFQLVTLQAFTTRRKAQNGRPGGQNQFLVDIAPAVWQAKEAQAQGGRVSSDDAMYWCARVLSAHPSVCRAVSARFDEIIIDEAQDTSALQMLCIDLLKTAGLNSLVLVGDFDQSIYGFNGASADASQALASKHSFTRKRLDENRRSSQAICDISAKLRGSAPDTAVGPHRDFGKTPSFSLYDVENISTLPGEFSSRMQQGALDASNSAVIARSNALVRDLKGRGEDLPLTLSHTRSFMRLSLDKSLAPDPDDLERAEKYLWVQLNDHSIKIGSDARPTGLAVRTGLIRLIDRLPDGRATFLDWINTFNLELVAILGELGIATKYAPPALQLPFNLRDTCVTEIAQASAPGEMMVTTVHGVKGRSLDGVLLVAAPTDWRNQAASWAEYFSEANTPSTIQSNEDMRVLYVALTRAQRVFQLALPSTTESGTIDRFLSAGFVQTKSYI